MTTTASTILEELRQVFPAKRPEPFGPLVNDSRGDEPAEVARAFQDKTDWTRLDCAWLDHEYVALSFLSNEALCFYIPAYMAADLGGHLGMADPAFILTNGLAYGRESERIHRRKPETMGDRAKERWASLTPAQALAIVHFLEWRIERSGPGNDGIADALRSYWYERAGAAE